MKKLDKREALLCVLAESTDEKNILKLVEALCREHGINLIKVSSTVIYLTIYLLTYLLRSGVICFSGT